MMTGCHFWADAWNFWFPLSWVHSLSLPRTLSVCVSRGSRACGLQGPGDNPQKPTLWPVSLPRPGAQLTNEAFSPQPGHCLGNHFLMRIRGSNKKGLDLGPHTRVRCSATCCPPRSSVLQAPRLPSAQKDLEGVGSVFPGGENRGPRMKILGHRLIYEPVGPLRHCLRSPVSEEDAESFWAIARPHFLAPGAQRGGHRTPDPIFP